MPETVPADRTRFGTAGILFNLGRVVFSAAIIGLGVETLICARFVGHSLGPEYAVIPALPWLPANPWIAYSFGAIWVLCGAGILSRVTLGAAAMTLSAFLFVCAFVLDVPKNAANMGSISLRTTAFEPLALASLAWLLGDRGATPLLARGSRFVLGLALVVFGIDHFLAFGYIASLIPHWIPWRVFWVVFFGVAFLAGGVSVALNLRQRWGAAGTGLMFATWVVTLHLPRVLGLYSIPGAARDPNEWSSLFIAVGLWGGLWALAGTDPGLDPERTERVTPVQRDGY
ncbi:MAG TPA: hypothetical protein VH350_03365 [Candidatus Sulfotelmatobacter sp.]|jgi:uncharacterized membrane protein|nr:hypothetical protein [Candidatus Sulfotelmatobacter sp.]